jgi:subtilisin family serine protease
VRTLGLPVVAALALVLSASLPGVPRVVALVDPALASGSDAIVSVADGQAEAVARAARAVGGTDVQALHTIDMVTARLDALAVRSLSRHVAVRALLADGEIVAADTDREPKGDRRGAKNAERSLQAINVPAAWREATGRGVTVALMDTGIAQHAAFGNRVVARVDFVGDGATAADPGGHGTFLAALIAGKTETFSGVAPGARLVSLRVLDQTGRGTVQSALRAVDWLLRNRSAYGVRVLNVSFGAPQRASYHLDPLAAAMESVWLSGIVVVAAAGNAGPSAGTIITPGADPFVVTAGGFAEAGSSQTGNGDRDRDARRDDDDDEGGEDDQDDEDDEDGASAQRNKHQQAEFSARGPTLDGFAKPDVLAPAVRVVSVRVAHSWLDEQFPARRVGEGFTTMSGTSVSAALTSGVATLVLESHRRYSPTQVKGALVGAARKMEGWSAPVLDAARALRVRPARVNANMLPSRLFLAVLVQQLQAGNVTWENVSWENISWENLTWENVSWENLTWEGVTWEGVTWEGVTWEGVTWEGVTWEGVTWEGVTWEGVTWEGVTWEGVTWEGVTWELLAEGLR